MTDFMIHTVPSGPRTAERQRKGHAMLLHEALARCRQQQAEQAAREYRLARSVTAGRGWAVLARFATRRAARARGRAAPLAGPLAAG